MDLQKDMRKLGLRPDRYTKEYLEFCEFQDIIYQLLQGRGIYLKGVLKSELITEERERLFHFTAKMWTDLHNY